jgi:hypothetical protein
MWPRRHLISHFAPPLRHHFNIAEIWGHHTLVAEFLANLQSRIRPSIDLTKDWLSQNCSMFGLRTVISSLQAMDALVSALMAPTIPPDSAR